jgi:hypothetical protein
MPNPFQTLVNRFTNRSALSPAGESRREVKPGRHAAAAAARMGDANDSPKHRASLMLTDSDGFYDQQSGPDQRDRFAYDRREVLRQALDAWRTNPIARRIVTIATQYMIGGGVTLTSKHKPTSDFIKDWWEHPLNQLPMRSSEWSDELIRSGELFLLLTTDPAGMTFVRAIPAIQIDTVITAPNDLQQEIQYTEAAGWDPNINEWADVRSWAAYNPIEDAPGETGRFAPVMLHYAINRPAGAVRGESDLAPLLKWLSRYSAWLEDRVRLNKYRNSFLYIVTAKFASEAERLSRQATINANPPNPGSIMVTDENETWKVIAPDLNSLDAKEDGLAIKKMIAAGVGLPLHFLAEPEQTSRTTAEASGGPTFRHLAQRQDFFVWLITDLAKAVIRRRAFYDTKIKPDAPIKVHAADLSPRDNMSIAQATNDIASNFIQLYNLGLIDDRELLRVVYRFAGEAVDVNELIKPPGMPATMPQAAPTAPSPAPAPAAPAPKPAPKTGSAK